MASRLHAAIDAARREKLLLVLLAALAALLAYSPGSVAYSVKVFDATAYLLVVSLIIVSRCMEASGAPAYIADRVLAATRGNPGLSMLLLTAATSLVASVFMNDSAVLIIVPIAVAIGRRCGCGPAAPAVLVGIAANIGSMASPIGNPQNIIIWKTYRLPAAVFTAALLPYAAALYAVLAAYTLIVMRGAKSPGEAPPPVYVDRGVLAVGVSGLVLVLLAGEHGYVSAAAAAALLAAIYLWRRIGVPPDPVLPMVFLLMFIDFNALAAVFPPMHVSGPMLLLYAAAVSQVMSNVPATIYLAGATGDWKALAVGVNIGGVLLATGSLANIIVLRLTGIRWSTMHKYMLPYGSASLALALAMYYAGI